MNNDIIEFNSCKKAIIGYSGFVGSYLKDNMPMPFDIYNSKNITDIQGKDYDIIFVAGLPATKWMINKEPEKDIINILQLDERIVKIKKFDEKYSKIKFQSKF